MINQNKGKNDKNTGKKINGDQKNIQIYRCGYKINESNSQFFILSDLHREEETEGERSSIHWFPPQMTATARAGPTQSQEPEAQGCGPFPDAFPGHKQRTGLEVEQMAPKLGPTWDTGTARWRNSQLSPLISPIPINYHASYSSSCLSLFSHSNSEKSVSSPKQHAFYLFLEHNTKDRIVI